MKSHDARKLEISREIHAPAEVVWTALSEAEELRRWFPLDARVNPGPGGSIWLSWGPGCEGEAPLHAWEPGRRLGWTEEVPDGTGGVVRLAVDFHVEGTGGTTVVRLVQSGFGEGAEWDDHYDAVGGGWRYFLFNLAWYLERHRGAPRTLVWMRRPTTRLRTDVWPTLLGPDGLSVTTGSGHLEEDDRGRVVFDGETLESDGRVVVARPPAHAAVVLPSLNDALLFVELEGSGPARWHCGVWLSTWGLTGQRVERLQAALHRMLTRLLPD